MIEYRWKEDCEQSMLSHADCQLLGHLGLWVIINRPKFLPRPAIRIASYGKPEINCDVNRNVQGGKCLATCLFLAKDLSLFDNVISLKPPLWLKACAGYREMITVWRNSIIHAQTESSKANYHGDIYGRQESIKWAFIILKTKLSSIIGILLDS